jgi:hypothetical protein
MTKAEWLSALAEVATDPEAAPGPRVRALELIGYSENWVPRFRRRWWQRRTDETK